MTKRVEMIGRRFGRLVVLKESERKGSRGQLYFDCLCDCGKYKTIMGESLRSHKTLSCGCYQVEKAKEVNTTHGGCCSGQTVMGCDRLYRIWHGVKDRCFNPNNPEYKNYGGKGVTICGEWMEYPNFRDFMLSIGYDVSKPSKEQTIDRVDVNGNYEPSNCRLLTLKEQQYNKTNNHYLTLNGETKTLSEWSREIGIEVSVLLGRLSRGMTEEEALITPKRVTEKYTVDGEIHTMHEWADILKMPWSTLRGKVKLDKQRLLEKEVRDRRSKGLC